MNKTIFLKKWEVSRFSYVKKVTKNIKIMGCLCSSPEPAPKSTIALPATEVNVQTVYEPTYIQTSEIQDKTPLLNAVSPAEITVTDSDTSDVDQEMIKNLLDQVELSSDEEQWIFLFLFKLLQNEPKTLLNTTYRIIDSVKFYTDILNY